MQSGRYQSAYIAGDSIPKEVLEKYRLLKNQHQYTLPICVPIGLGLGAIGVLDLSNTPVLNDANILPGVFVLVSGIVVCFVLPPVLISSANRRMRKLKSTYPDLVFRSGSNGIGLTLVF